MILLHYYTYKVKSKKKTEIVHYNQTVPNALHVPPAQREMSSTI